MSVSTVCSILHNVREFFEWLTIHPQYVRKIDGRAIQYLRLSNNTNRAARASREKTPPKLFELEKALIAMPHKTDIEKQDRSIFAFMVITCVRDDALVSLKRKHVNADEKTVWQDPKFVRTKGRKGIVTRFVSQPIPLAEEIVLEWLKYADTVLNFKPNDPLFPKTLVMPNPESMMFEVQGLSREHWANAGSVRDVFQGAFHAVGLPYYNPHLFRKTICKWALKNCTQYEYKAISQNIGHDHAMTTHNSYSNLTEDEQLEAVSNIGMHNTDLKNVTIKDLLDEVTRRTK